MSHSILHHHIFAGRRKKPVSLLKVHDKAAKIIALIISWPLSKHFFFFLCLCNEIRSTHKTRDCLVMALRKKPCVIIWVITWTSWLFCFTEHHCYNLKGQIQVWLLRLGYLADIFLTVNKAVLSLEGKQITVFVANDKTWSFKWKLEF